MRALALPIAACEGGPRRLYPTGLSMGGRGPLRLAAYYPGRARPDLPRFRWRIRRHPRASDRYTEYPRVGHNAWDPAHADPPLLDWLLAHRRYGTLGAIADAEGRVRGSGDPGSRPGPDLDPTPRSAPPRS